MLLRDDVEIPVWDLGLWYLLPKNSFVRRRWGSGVFNDYGSQGSKLQIGAEPCRLLRKRGKQCCGTPTLGTS